MNLDGLWMVYGVECGMRHGCRRNEICVMDGNR